MAKNALPQRCLDAADFDLMAWIETGNQLGTECAKPTLAIHEGDGPALIEVRYARVFPIGIGLIVGHKYQIMKTPRLQSQAYRRLPSCP